MTPLAVVILALGMSADAFAASLGRGAALRPTFPRAVRDGLVFGVIEAITPVIGWALGLAAAGFVGAVDHWIAFILLAIVGGKMAWEGTRSPVGDEQPSPVNASPWALVAMAVGTSIDAAAVGVSLAFISANIIVIALAIGCATFVMTTIGMTIGRLVGMRFGKIAELVGGIALIGLGTSILLEHLGIIG